MKPIYQNLEDTSFTDAFSRAVEHQPDNPLACFEVLTTLSEIRTLIDHMNHQSWCYPALAQVQSYEQQWISIFLSDVEPLFLKMLDDANNEGSYVGKLQGKFKAIRLINWAMELTTQHNNKTLNKQCRQLYKKKVKTVIAMGGTVASASREAEYLWEDGHHLNAILILQSALVWHRRAKLAAGQEHLEKLLRTYAAEHMKQCLQSATNTGFEENESYWVLALKLSLLSGNSISMELQQQFSQNVSQRVTQLLDTPEIWHCDTVTDDINNLSNQPASPLWVVPQQLEKVCQKHLQQCQQKRLDEIIKQQLSKVKKQPDELKRIALLTPIIADYKPHLPTSNPLQTLLDECLQAIPTTLDKTLQQQSQFVTRLQTIETYQTALQAWPNMIKDIRQRQHQQVEEQLEQTLSQCHNISLLDDKINHLKQSVATLEKYLPNDNPLRQRLNDYSMLHKEWQELLSQAKRASQQNNLNLLDQLFQQQSNSQKELQQRFNETIDSPIGEQLLKLKTQCKNKLDTVQRQLLEIKAIGPEANTIAQLRELIQKYPALEKVKTQLASFKKQLEIQGKRLRLQLADQTIHWRVTNRVQLGRDSGDLSLGLQSLSALPKCVEWTIDKGQVSMVDHRTSLGVLLKLEHKQAGAFCIGRHYYQKIPSEKPVVLPEQGELVVGRMCRLAFRHWGTGLHIRLLPPFQPSEVGDKSGRVISDLWPDWKFDSEKQWIISKDTVSWGIDHSGLQPNPPQPQFEIKPHRPFTLRACDGVSARLEGETEPASLLYEELLYHIGQHQVVFKEG